jgi:hypothetical protein
MRAFRRFRLTAAVIAACAIVSAPASGQPMAESALKAAFLYNFAKFTTWPADALPPGAAITLCVVDDGTVTGMLRQVVAGKPIDGREVRVLPLTRDAALRACQIVYIPGEDGRLEADVLNRLKTTAALTVGDGHGSPRAGIIARLFVDGGKMRFAINVDAAQRARLHISSKVLALGVVMKDEADGAH